MQRKTLYLLIGITVLAGVLRFWNLGAPTLWIDEVLFTWYSAEPIPTQELVPALIGKVLPLDNEFWVRFPFALAGTLTVPFIYAVLKNKKFSLEIVLLAAVFPLLVFWSRMARPYCFAGLFIVLGWRWKWFYLVALLTTPASLLGINLVKIKERWGFYLALLVGAFVLYNMRTDVQAGKDFLNVSFLFNTQRIWYVPILATLLYTGDYLLPRFVVRNSKNRKR